MSTVQEAPKTIHQQPMMSGDRMFSVSASNDNVMMKQILATHAHDGREVDVRAILHIVEDIFQRSSPTTVDGLITPVC
uniref:Sieve element occlusion N-terminal domain-containing protein n=1 Tax=Nelumbo nucifera TaxID=4432 RepID=A0A822YGJ3_NELNU|nr:TPA_asm: hypothetical protein HUJ06_009220 [Nelumbo nucifera]